ncbi:MAG: hypothetical protein AWU57_1594 [Marinobacter sp. T13-3]|jgi:hypothetical protein|nr:MAG: hypothetical protein AWU57_1594 [Marinobacter sp. T13-3]
MRGLDLLFCGLEADLAEAELGVKRAPALLDVEARKLGSQSTLVETATGVGYRLRPSACH